jgi:protein-S-isoprenylcysteine O-methyltransferase Ste14
MQLFSLISMQFSTFYSCHRNINLKVLIYQRRKFNDQTEKIGHCQDRDHIFRDDHRGCYSFAGSRPHRPSPRLVLFRPYWHHPNRSFSNDVNFETKEVINARGKVKPTKGWDKIFVLLYSLSTLILSPLIAGLDIGRFHWSYLNIWWMVPGVTLFLAAMALSEWAIFENRFFETTVRIQKERGHKVVSTGPYAIVRHPGYLGMIMLFLAFPLIVGSLYALFVSIFVTILFIVRTGLEDQTLKKELKGYAVYAKKVRYRLLPWIW